MAEKENVGGIQMDAELDVSKFDKGLKAVEGKLKGLDPALKKTEEGFKKVEQASNKASLSFGTLVKSIVGANIIESTLRRSVSWLQQWGRAIIGASSNLTELTSKAQVVFGESFPKMQSQARTVGQEVGRASSAILQFATDIGSVIKAFGITGPLLDDMSVRLARLAVDMASFHNASDQDAFMALRSGLTGETEPLKRFGIVLTDINLQLFAQEKGLKQNVSAMNQAQKTALRYEFIMAKTADAQGDAARTADSFANQTRRLEGEIQSLNEEAGKLATPVLADGLGFLAKAIQNTRLFVRALTKDIASLIEMMRSIPGAGAIKSAVANTVRSIPFATETIELLKGTNAFFGSVKPRIAEELEAEKGLELGEKLDALNNFGSLGGGTLAKDGAGSAEEVLDKMKKAEADLLKILGDQAKANLDNLNIRKKELEIRRDLNLATDKELRELNRINNRVEYQADAVDEATKAWEKQKGVVEDLRDEITAINEDIEDTSKALEDRLADIDSRTAGKRQDRVTELVRERNEIMARSREALSAEDGLRLSKIDAELVGSTEQERFIGETRTGETELQQISREGEEEKAQARLEAEEKLVEMRTKLKDKTDELSRAEVDLRSASDAVVTALERQAVAAQSNFQAIETRTKEHVDRQVKELNRLASAYAGLYGPGSGAAASQQAASELSGVARGYANGGLINGPGSDRSDNLLVRVSPGERIISAATERLYKPILEMIHNRTFPLQRFADGGVVNSNNNNSKSATIHNHYHGGVGRRSDDLTLYAVRRAMR